MMARVSIRCSACGTDNPDSARLCSMCRTIFGRPSTAAPAPAARPPPSGLELAHDPRAPVPRSTPPPSAARSSLRPRAPVPPKDFVLPGGWRIRTTPVGFVLHVRYSLAPGGYVRAAVLLGVAGLFFYVSRLGIHEPVFALSMLALALLFGLAGLYGLGMQLDHAIDANVRSVTRARAWLGVPLGTWTATITDDAQVVVEHGIKPRRGPPFHRVVLRTGTGDTFLGGSTSLDGCHAFGDDVAAHLGLAAPRDVGR